MTVRRPDVDDIAVAAQHFGITVDESDRAELVDLVDGALGSYDVVEDLYAECAAPTTPLRDYTIAESGESNPLGAWYVTTSIRSENPADDRLAGRRVAIKDNVAVAGVPMMNGSRSLEGFVPARDATVVSRLLDAGADIVGKSVCEDLCFSGSSFTPATGPVRNPWDRDREAGGSSGGSAALVASGEVDLAIGGDQGGSVRIPAAFCGVVGHKPTFGLVPYTGAFPIERTIDHLGPIAPTVEDAALMLSVLAGSDGHDPRQAGDVVVADYVSGLARGIGGVRIGVVEQGFGQASSQPEVDATVRAAVQQCSDAGAIVESVSIPWHLDAFHIWNVIATDGAAYQMLDGNGYGLNAGGLYDPEQMEFFARQRVRNADQLSETVKLVALCGYHGVSELAATVYAKARNLVPIARAAYDDALAEYDVLVMPTVPYAATELPDLASIDRGTYLTKALGMVVNTAPFDVTGHPALSVPAGLVDGLPVGMMIAGKHHDDATVLRVGHAFEQLRGDLGVPAIRRTTASEFASA
ncbi:amidase [Gordonia polyisoprenivorans]|nr:amidase [Gordonia polyisoprenivorans]QTI71443.1 amidase [Gordonia polyisoprenivorans]